jgi:hypothetical protein
MTVVGSWRFRLGPTVSASDSQSIIRAPMKEVVTMGRGILLWLLGIPIPVIILLYLFHVV